MNWYYAVGQEQKGPVTNEQLSALLAAGTLTPETLVWREGLATWQAYREVSGNAVPLPPTPPTAVGGILCAECAQPFAPDQVVRFGDRYVCAACKPTYVQRLQEGAVTTSGLDYAGFGIRFGAKFLDGLILWVVNAAFGFAMGLSMGFTATTGDKPNFLIIGITVLVQVFVNLAYSTFFVGKFGATPGKMACKLKVVRADGSPLGYGRAAARMFAELLSGMICYVGYFMAHFDEEKRSLHDRLCDTRVIKVG